MACLRTELAPYYSVDERLEEKRERFYQSIPERPADATLGNADEEEVVCHFS